MRTCNLFVALVVVATLTGCDKDVPPVYTPTKEVVTSTAPPPVLINPLGTNADGMLGFQLGASQFLTSQDGDALIASVVAGVVEVRDRTGVKQVRIGNGRQDTDTQEVKTLEKKLKELGFTVTVVKKIS